MKQKRRWTQDEIDILKEGTKSDKELAQELNRTEDAVSVMRSKLGIVHGYRPWTQREVDLLYTDLSSIEIASMIDRSRNAVDIKRSKLIGSKVCRPWSYSDIQKVMKHEMPDAELSLVLGRSRDAIWSIRSKVRRGDILGGV